MAIFSPDIVTSAISASIADTAVDIFVYDTSKDSDGGAWRKKTQHTSWYNEAAAAGVRGSRKEFPAVAVIVAEETKVTIYDGDDPDLPMWMIFENGGNDPFLDGSTPGSTFLGNYAPTSVSAFNGIICVGTFRSTGALTNLNAGLRKFSFIEDACYATNDTNTYKLGTTFVDRGTATMSQVTQGGAIVNVNVKDVAMTVLPNAPIDSATGLPVPTIAVATDGGVSVIKDDGNVVDITQNSPYTQSHNVFFSDYGKILYDNEDTQVVYEVDIPSADIGYGAYNSTSNGRVIYPVGDHGGFSSGEIRLLGSNISNGGRLITKGAFAVDENGTTESEYGPVGLSLFDRAESDPAKQSLVAYVASDYNTGWMHGDVKGAFLSDTDTTDAVAAYYDDFVNNDKGWGFVDTSITGGNMVITQQGSARSTDGDALNGIATGTKLVFTFTVSGSGTGSVVFDDDGAGAGVGGNTNYGSFNSTGSKTFTATKTASNRIRIMRTSGSNDYEIDFLNISTEYDRSANDNPLTVYGTLTRTPVATGAELVSYSGFSGSDYLQQPYNSDLDFGTGDLNITFWFKTPSGSTPIECILHRGDGGTGTWGSGKLIQIEYNSTNLAAYLAESAFSTTDNVNIPIATAANGQWSHYSLVRSGTFLGVYFNGELMSSTTSTRDVSNTSAKTWIGERPNVSRPLTTTSLALFRMSKSAPSPEQIKKIYEDEKVLFQENAKATLHGSSDDVTALSYDEVTDQLHVGTSGGRSDFQGLRQINNTTDPVTTAISAHDSLIIEQ